MDHKKQLHISLVLFVFLFGFFLKALLAFSLPIFHDVGWYISLAHYYDHTFMNLIVLEHPPFGYYPYFLFLTLFGTEDFVLRLVPFCFAVLEVFLMYLIAKNWFGKTTAQYTIILFSLTYFAAINALSPEGDGSIMSVISLLLFYCFFEYYQRHERKWLFWSGIFLGLHLLIKVRAVLFLIPLFLYSIYKTRNFFKTVVHMTIIGLLALIFFSIFPLLIVLENPNTYQTLLRQVLLHNTGSFSLLYKVLHPQLFTPLFILFSFLFLFLFFKGISPLQTTPKTIFEKQGQDHIVLLVLWFGTLFVILLGLLPEGLASAYPRYIAFLLPPLFILCAHGLQKLHLGNRRMIFILAGSILLFLVFLFFNQIASVPSGYWYFVTAAMGVLKISKMILFFVFGTSFVLLFFFFFLKKKRLKTIAIALFLIVNFSFHLMLIIDPLVDHTHKNILADFTSYAEQHDLKKPLFLWAEDLAFYLNIPGKNINLITDPALHAYAEKIGYTSDGYYYMRIHDADSMSVLEKQGGTVFALYYPLKYTLDTGLERKQEYDYLIAHCTLLASYDYAHAKGVIFEC